MSKPFWVLRLPSRHKYRHLSLAPQSCSQKGWLRSPSGQEQVLTLEDFSEHSDSVSALFCCLAESRSSYLDFSLFFQDLFTWVFLKQEMVILIVHYRVNITLYLIIFSLQAQLYCPCFKHQKFSLLCYFSKFVYFFCFFEPGYFLFHPLSPKFLLGRKVTIRVLFTFNTWINIIIISLYLFFFNKVFS